MQTITDKTDISNIILSIELHHYWILKQCRNLLQGECILGPPCDAGPGEKEGRCTAACLPAPARSCRAAAGGLARVRCAARPLGRPRRGRHRAARMARLCRALPLPEDAAHLHCHTVSLAVLLTAHQVAVLCFIHFLHSQALLCCESLE